MSEIISRKEARAAGLTRYFTGKACKHGHVVERLVANSTCLECHRANFARSYAANPEKALEAKRKWNEANPEKLREWVRENPEKVREAQRKWKKANPAKITAHIAKRKASKLQRTPAFGAQDLIPIFYEAARSATERTGIPHQVDHIIPLRGKNVSGLHVFNNLQILTASENASKNNAWEAC